VDSLTRVDVHGAVANPSSAVENSQAHVSALLGGHQVEDSLSVLVGKSEANQPLFACGSDMTTMHGVPLRRATTSGLVQGGEATQGDEIGASMPDGLHRWSKSTVELVERACKFVPAWKQMPLPIRAVVIRSFADVSSDIGLPSGAVLISEGASLYEMYVVIEGSFVSTSSQVVGADHDEEIALSVFIPGDAMCEMCLYEQKQRPTSKVTITCAANGSRVCALRASTFRKIALKVDDLNEDMPRMRFLKSLPYFPTLDALTDAANWFEEIAFASVSDLQRALSHLERENEHASAPADALATTATFSEVALDAQLPADGDATWLYDRAFVGARVLAVKSGLLQITLKASNEFKKQRDATSVASANTPYRTAPVSLSFRPGDVVGSRQFHALINEASADWELKSANLHMLVQTQHEGLASVPQPLPATLSYDANITYARKLLMQMPIFANNEIEEADVTRLMGASRLVTFPTGTRLYKENGNVSVSGCVWYLILSGTAKILVNSSSAEKIKRRMSFDQSFLQDAFGHHELVPSHHHKHDIGTRVDSSAGKRSARESSRMDQAAMMAAAVRAVKDETCDRTAPETESQVSISMKASEAGGTVLAELLAGDHFGGDALLSQLRRVNGTFTFASAHTVCATSELTCLAVDAPACGELAERLRRALSREQAGWRWAVANRNALEFTDLRFYHTLGQGSYASVRLAVLQEGAASGQIGYAIKIVHRAKLAKAHNVQQLKRERDILSMCNHPMVLRLAAAYQNKTAIMLLLDLELGGELFTLMRKRGRFNLEEARFYTACVASALDYFATLGIAYRDLKPENLLVDRKGYLKVIDLGFCKVLRTCHGRSFTFCGTPEYMAPELFMFLPHSEAVDMWALGCLLYELLIGRTPFAPKDGGYNDAKVMETVVEYAKADSPTLPMPWWRGWFLDGAARTLIEQLLTIDDRKRITASQVLQHEFFSEIDFEDLERKELPSPYVPEIAHVTDTSNIDFEDDSEDDDDDDLDLRHACSEARKTLAGFVTVADDALTQLSVKMA